MTWLPGNFSLWQRLEEKGSFDSGRSSGIVFGAAIYSAVNGITLQRSNKDILLCGLTRLIPWASTHNVVETGRNFFSLLILRRNDFLSPNLLDVTINVNTYKASWGIYIRNRQREKESRGEKPSKWYISDERERDIYLSVVGWLLSASFYTNYHLPSQEWTETKDEGMSSWAIIIRNKKRGKVNCVCVAWRKKHKTG